MTPSDRAAHDVAVPPPGTPFPDPPHDLRVRALLMTDGERDVQVIAPERALLDVTAVSALWGRELHAQPFQVAQATCALPGYYGLPVLLDESLIRRGKLALAIETVGEYIELSGPELTMTGCELQLARMALAIGTEPTPSDRSNDMDRIGSTLSRFTAQRMQQRLDQTLHIPPLPDAAQRIVALQSDPDYNLQDLVSIIETDPSMAARIMGWANSAFYHPDPPARGISDAVMRVLGFDTVMSMALGMALGQTLRLPDSHVRGLPPFWLDAVFTAATMEALARQMPRKQRPVSGLCYLTGLLANFGTLVTGHTFPHQYAAICRLQEANRHLPHTYVDHHVLQMPRELLSSALLECWGLPTEVTDAIRFQYLIDYQGESATYVHLLGLSRRLLGTQGITDMPPDEPAMSELAALGLDADGVRDVVELLNDSRDQLDEFATSITP